MSTFPSPEALLAHRPPNLLLGGVTAWNSEAIEAYADIRPGQWYSNADGSMPAWVGIELMAQGIAAFVGLEARHRGNPPRIGYLLGTRAYTCALPDFPAAARLGIAARLIFRDSSGLGAFDCTLSLAGTTVAEATLKVYEEPAHE